MGRRMIASPGVVGLAELLEVEEVPELLEEERE